MARRKEIQKTGKITLPAYPEPLIDEILKFMFRQLKDKNDAFVPIIFQKKDLAEHIGLTEEETSQILSEIFSQADKRVITIIDEKSAAFVPWFSFMDKSQTEVRYKLNPGIKTFLFGLQETIPLPIEEILFVILSFRVMSGARLYYLLKEEHKNGKTETYYDVCSFCEKLNLPSAYNPKKHKLAIKKQVNKVIQPTVEDINTATELSVSYEPVMENDVQTGWLFHVSNKDNTLAQNNYPKLN